MKPIDDLTFIDDYMFGEIMKNKEICKEVIERLTHLKVRDIEMQNWHYDALGMRTRFYQSLIDADNLLAGMDYKNLPESIIIFICTTDPFNDGLQRYTFRTKCDESDSADLNDRILKLIYNASAWYREDDPEIKAFLRFVSSNETSDDFTDGLLKSIAKVKRNEIFRKEYMSMGVWETDIRDDARQQGIQQGAQEKAVETALNLLKKSNLSTEVIADCCSLPLEEIKRLALELEKDAVQL